MEFHFKKARKITFLMMGSVLFFAVMAGLLSKPHGYGGSSEAKMNFLRLIVYVVSGVQVLMGATLKKILLFGATTGDKAKKRLVAQIVGNALCESPVLFGMVLVFMTKSFLDYGICGAISLAGLWFVFPKQKDWTPVSV